MCSGYHDGFKYFIIMIAFKYRIFYIQKIFNIKISYKSDISLRKYISSIGYHEFRTPLDIIEMFKYTNLWSYKTVWNTVFISTLVNSIFLIVVFHWKLQYHLFRILNFPYCNLNWCIVIWNSNWKMQVIFFVAFLRFTT